MTVDLTNPIFHDNDKAREHLEEQRWPKGPFCPHCGETENFARLHGKSHRPGLFHCNSCEQAFTVTVGSVMERSKIPLCKWVLAYHLMAASKKGMSSKQLERMLGVTYKTAWFLTMRIREAMGPDARTHGPIGGEGKIVERTKPLSAAARRTSMSANPNRASMPCTHWSSAGAKSGPSMFPT
jgi:transposase-like protein